MPRKCPCLSVSAWFRKPLGIVKIEGEVFEPKLHMFYKNQFPLTQSTYFIIAPANKKHFLDIKGTYNLSPLLYIQLIFIYLLLDCPTTSFKLTSSMLVTAFDTYLTGRSSRAQQEYQVPKPRASTQQGLNWAPSDS